MAVSLVVLTSVVAQPTSGEREQAIAAILKVGGKVQRDEKRPGRPVVSVELTACEVTAAGLKHLPALAELESLDL
jgi:hypothetical protein